MNDISQLVQEVNGKERDEQAKNWQQRCSQTANLREYVHYGVVIHFVNAFREFEVNVRDDCCAIQFCTRQHKTFRRVKVVV